MELGTPHRSTLTVKTEGRGETSELADLRCPPALWFVMQSRASCTVEHLPQGIRSAKLATSQDPDSLGRCESTLPK